jgi:hypothetical protein
MDTEKSSYRILLSTLLNLGYPESSIHSDVTTLYGRRADLVVYEFDKPKIVFELKDPQRFSSITATLEAEDKLKFDPTVRQAQQLAQEMSAPYFAVSDGITILWFDVDQETGRPRLLTNPILPKFKDGVSEKITKKQILKILFDLADFSRGYLTTQEYSIRVGVVLLARLLAEKDDSKLEHLLLAEKSNLEEYDKVLRDLSTHSYENDVRFYAQAFFELNKIKLLEIPPADFVTAIDDFIQLAVGKHSFGEFKLSKWTSDFLARLLLVNAPENLLDIYSNFGDGVYAINNLSKDVRIVSATSHSTSYVWDKVKRLILGLDPDDVIYTPRITTDEQIKVFKPTIKHYDKILVSPPFGGRPSLNEYIPFKKSEEIFIYLSLKLAKPGGRVVAVVPENLLFSSTSTSFRTYLSETAWVRAIISLEQFLPNLGIKASIIVVDKKSPKNQGGNILMSRITKKDIGLLADPDSSLLDSNHIKKILNLYEAHMHNKVLQSEKSIWFTSTNELEGHSWAVDYYDPSSQIETNSEYPLFPLNQLASLRKGSPLTLDKNGALPVIGPGALRSFSIDSAKFDKTIEENLPKNPVVSQVKDILIHGVGTYRGQAALVEPGLENCFVSRNIIVLRDISTVVLPSYLVIALNSTFVQRQLEDRATGSVFSQFSVEKLKDLQIPVPSLEKQKWLIEKISATRQKLLEYEQQVLITQSALKEQQSTLQNILENIHLGGGENA